MLRNLDFGGGVAFRWEWKFGLDPSDFDGHLTLWLGPFRFWVFY